MSTIIVPIAEEDLAFLRTYSAAQGTTAEELLSRQARTLRENLERPLHADVVAISGIAPEGVDAKSEYLAHIEAKHQ